MPAALHAPSRPSRQEAGSDFAPLARRVRDSGLLDRRRGYYARVIGLNLAATAAVWGAVAWAGDSWWTVLLGVPLAVVAARTGFLGHDAGHRQIARSARVNRWLGLVLGNLLLGMGHGWWSDKHNRHHANPNHVGKDPDVGEGVLAWTAEQAGRQRGVLRWVARHQAALFFPLLTLEGVNLKIGSLLFLRGRSRRDQVVEGGLLLAHAVGYLALALSLLPVEKAVALMVVQHALFGLHLGAVFAPNHKGMAMPEPGQRWGHLRRQVLTSRNVRGGSVTDWAMGGLNYQIEHHLFPGVPRCNLRKMQPMVREHCAAVGVPYTETGLVASYREALGHMREIGEPLR
ncbi:fatty acid desaturase family protein [Actinomadura madurae]|uniref:fatty acid desaturase family protein n=1 Tax=Actinomadura madurae TaxID=1993 RepID=UPI0020273EA3|nr:acyl-CoA desaturase [Actinomadura madurae]MCP9947545.1 acyl-CoA desaturase [Actinomadura madurae]MCP9964314.1 acyl-CoA desaturase [Actinomadura madurae]MCQ0011717.1 acyl-CoA desaturase [Actinomadura madurae]MCQ0012980.1 acyl-CoA desaturase [Actinomadura madurae]URN03939.1 acyl-CoA desaturase [Actinomadura madurae]